MSEYPLVCVTDSTGTRRYYRPDTVTSAQMNHYKARTHADRTWPESWNAWVRLLSTEMITSPSFRSEGEAEEWIREALYGVTVRQLSWPSHPVDQGEDT